MTMTITKFLKYLLQLYRSRYLVKKKIKQLTFGTPAKHYPNSGCRPLHHSNQVSEAVNRYSLSYPLVPGAVRPMKYPMEIPGALLNLLVQIITSKKYR